MRCASAAAPPAPPWSHCVAAPPPARTHTHVSTELLCFLSWNALSSICVPNNIDHKEVLMCTYKPTTKTIDSARTSGDDIPRMRRGTARRRRWYRAARPWSALPLAAHDAIHNRISSVIIATAPTGLFSTHLGARSGRDLLHGCRSRHEERKSLGKIK